MNDSDSNDDDDDGFHCHIAPDAHTRSAFSPAYRAPASAANNRVIDVSSIVIIEAMDRDENPSVGAASLSKTRHPLSDSTNVLSAWLHSVTQNATSFIRSRRPLIAAASLLVAVFVWSRPSAAPIDRSQHARMELKSASGTDTFHAEPAPWIETAIALNPPAPAKPPPAASPQRQRPGLPPAPSLPEPHRPPSPPQLHLGVPPLVPPPTLSVVDELNRRFNVGGHSSDLRHAGVLVHTFDKQEADGSPWLPCSTPKWCAGFGDRWAASILYRGGSNVLFQGSGSRGGLIFRPAKNAILCSYATDGGSMTITCDDPHSDPALDAQRGCTPGCYREGIHERASSTHSAMCSRLSSNWGLKAACAFAPEDLDDMMATHQHIRRGYNEVIVDARVYRANLPLSLYVQAHAG